MAEKRWAGNTFGNGWMHKWLVRFLRLFGVVPFYLFCAVFVVPVCLVFCDSRRTAYAYFRERQSYGALKALWFTYVNHLMFSQVVIDRFAMYAGKKFNVEVDGRENFNNLAEKTEGFVQLSSHIGNYEIAGYSLVSDHKVINAVVYAFEKESVMRGRSSMFDRTNIRMIVIENDMSHLYAIDRALSDGEIVSFPTDRFMGGGRCIECDFMGGIAKFPLGPFSVAAMRGLDVLAVNVMKSGLKKYTIYVTPLEYDRNAPRKEQISQLSRSYIRELEKRLRQYPAQWYNFYDFWV